MNHSKMTRITTHSLKITKAGYVYIDAVKVSVRRLTPIQIPYEIPDWALERCRAWLHRNYTMAQPGV